MTVRSHGGARVMRAMEATALVFLAVLLASGAVAPAARADGDPASDVLVSQTVFLPSDAGVSDSQQAQLNAYVKAAHRAGLPVRVAVIPDAYDLGSVGALWLKPRTYAQFLGIELSLVFNGPLLVVMPNGFGLNWPGHSTAESDRMLATVTLNAGSGGLVTGAEAAVRVLAATHGIAIATPRPPAAAVTRGGHAWIWIAGAAVVALLAAVLAAQLARRRRRRRLPVAVSEPPVVAPVAPERRTPTRLGWAVPGLALVCCVAIGTPILVVARIRHSAAPAPTVKPSADPAAFTWRPGQRRAPAFRLVDQSGRSVSLDAYRGRPVIVTFIDPLCRNLCPLAAQVLDQVDRQLPPSERVPIIAVSVDIYADTHADLMLDFREWSLVPQWRWAIGAPKQLAAVWKRWEVGVSVTTKRIARTTVHFITHDEVAFLVDAGGFERARLVWPYGPQDVETELRQLFRPTPSPAQ